MNSTQINYIVFFLILVLFTSTYSTTFAYASIPGIKMFLCGNNPLSGGGMFDKEDVTPGQIMNNCKERLDGYSWSSRIYTLIYAPGFNENPHSLETIGNNPDNPITARSKEGSMTLEDNGCNGFIETGRDHGLFYGSIKLSGFRYDMTGDGRPDNFGGNRCHQDNSILDDGSGRVEAKQEGGVTISFQYDEDNILSKTAKYSWREATLNFDQEEYIPGDKAVLTLTDLDNVRFPFDDEFGFPIRIYSDTDTAGIDLLAYWVANYKGIVQMNGNYPVTIELIDEDISKDASNAFNHSRGELRVSIGDTIYAEYFDYTLPKPSMIGDSKKITAISKVVETKNPLLEKSLAEETESDERKIEFKKYTSDGKYLFTVWWDRSIPTTGNNTFNISIVDGKTQKDVFNIPYILDVVGQNKPILQQKNTHNGDESIHMPLDTEGIVEITLSEIGPSTHPLTFQFQVDASSDELIMPIIADLNHQNIISDKIKSDLIMWVKHGNDELFRNCLHDLMQTNMMIYSEIDQKKTNQAIPTWLVMNTNSWLDDSISDMEFLNGLEYLIQKGIL